VQHRTSDSALTRLINDARHARLLGPTALDELLTRCVRARALIDPHQRPTRSDLEDAFRRFCTRHRLPLPEINAVLADLKGRRSTRSTGPSG
jgi:hypothetical protein